MSKMSNETGVTKRDRNTQFGRDKIMAKLSSWLPNRTGVKILRIVNANGGIAFINEDDDRVRIMFPSVKVSAKDPRKVFGIILDRDKGWVICTFVFNRDKPAKSQIASIVKQLGYDEDPSLLSTMYSLFVSAPQDQSARELMDIIKLLVRITKFSSNS